MRDGVSALSGMVCCSIRVGLKLRVVTTSILKVMLVMKITPVDFETKKIELRPEYPPEPVGVAVKWQGRWKYMAWGHPTKNNCTKAEARKVLTYIYTHERPVFHHAAFDITVGTTHLGLPFPKNDFHDTLFLAYLFDPREPNLGLKVLADVHLGMPPEEQQELKAWIIKHVYEARGIKESRKDPWGAHIWEAPGDLAGKYAKGDIIRTWKLFEYYYPYIEQQGMMEAYDRERLCLPIFESMSETGICVAERKLAKDLKGWEKQLDEMDGWIRKRVRTPDLDIGSSRQLAVSLEKTNKVSHWIYTAPTKRFPKGQKSTKRENLIKVCTDKKLVETLGRRSILQTYISTFGKRWLESANTFEGRIYPNFNQVRNSDDYSGKTRGTKTGRPSSDNPNLLNVPRNQEDPLLPNMRDYIIPDPGTVFCIRDYSQQELRITAHYEEGDLYQYYLNDPRLSGEKNEKLWADAHVLVKELIIDTIGIAYPRPHVKAVNFGKIYGMGAPGVAGEIEGSIEEGRQLIRAHEKALPGIKNLDKEIQKWCKQDNPIYTWGGREYFVEESTWVKNRLREWYYKMLNLLIQGSAADCTKEAMIRVDEALRLVEGRLVLQVYDEIAACVPKGKEKRGMKLVKEAMESVEFDVPMLTDGKIGRISWGQAIKYKD